MVIKEAELLFQAGALQVPVIKQSNTGDGWIVSLEGTHPMIETARGGIKGSASLIFRCIFFISKTLHFVPLYNR